MPRKVKVAAGAVLLWWYLPVIVFALTDRWM